MAAALTEVTRARARAAEFVVSHGDELCAHRARALTQQQDAGPAIRLLPGCRDGARPRVGELLRSIAILDELHALGSAAAERCCAELARSQSEDGAWSDSAAAGEKERIFSTGMIAGHLAKTQFVRQSALDAAADYLAARWDPDRVKGAAWGATSAYLHCFALVRHRDADAILQWCGRELERGLRTGLYDAVRTARLFALCRAHGVPGAQLDRAELLDRLLEEQRADGSFQLGDDGAKRARVAHTLDALAGLASYSR